MNPFCAIGVHFFRQLSGRASGSFRVDERTAAGSAIAAAAGSAVAAAAGAAAADGSAAAAFLLPHQLLEESVP
jgi:hypothetical protein